MYITKQVNRAPYCFIYLRPCLITKGPQQYTAVYVNDGAMLPRSGGRSDIVCSDTGAPSFLQATHLAIQQRWRGLPITSHEVGPERDFYQHEPTWYVHNPL